MLRRSLMSVLGMSLLYGVVGASDSEKDSHDLKSDSLCFTYRNSGYEVLYASEVFNGAFIGESPITPTEVLALRCMTREPDPLVWLTNLVQSGSMPGQLYALVALRALDPEGFKRLLPQYASRKDEVDTFIGCIFQPRLVGDLATWIRSGEYSGTMLPHLAHLLPKSTSEWVTGEIPEAPR